VIQKEMSKDTEFNTLKRVVLGESYMRVRPSVWISLRSKAAEPSGNPFRPCGFESTRLNIRGFVIREINALLHNIYK
jgi:hypothetical protein